MNLTDGRMEKFYISPFHMAAKITGAMAEHITIEAKGQFSYDYTIGEIQSMVYTTLIDEND